MIKKTIELYKFNELSEDVQQSVINQNRDYNVTHYYWNYYYDSFIDDMKAYGLEIEPSNIYFSGFSSQGDGLSFTGSIDLLQYLKKTKQLTQYKRLVKELREFSSNEVYIDQSGSYYHEYTMSLHDDIGLLDDELAQDQYYNELESELLEFIRDQARQLYKRIEKEYFYLISDKSIREALIDNDCNYRSDGRLEQ